MPNNPEPLAQRFGDAARVLATGRTYGRPRNTKAALGQVVVVGASSDVPRALDHPVIGSALEVAEVFAFDEVSALEEGEAERLTAFLRELRPRAILLAGPVGVSAMQTITDLALLYDCELLAVMPTEVLAGHEPVIVWRGERPLVQLASGARRNVTSRAKRLVDIIGAGMGLIVAAPVIAVLAVLIRLESKGAPIFRHERVGFKGRRFSCLKLRTMRPDAESWLRADPALYEEYRRNHFKIAEDRDPRVTKLGRILRQTSLDELPQLWNVLRGDMSLIGPRPVVDDELDVYGPSRDLLLSVRPGLSGAWAVSGRHAIGYPERCAIELDYVRNWSLMTDLRIALQTIRVLVRLR